MLVSNYYYDEIPCKYALLISEAVKFRVTAISFYNTTPTAIVVNWGGGGGKEKPPLPLDGGGRPPPKRGVPHL